MELAAFSDRGIGTRERLEDYAADRIITTAGGLQLQIAMVCDGAGGGEAGELAARLTSRTIFEFLEISPETSVPKLLIRAVEQANKAVYSELHGTGTSTVSMAAVHLNDSSSQYGRLYIANVGNSRVYLIRGGHIVRLNIDHTLANEYVFAGQMSFEEAKQLEDPDYVTRAIGIGAQVSVDIGFYAERGKNFVTSKRAFRIGQRGMELQEGDTVFAASDGLFPYVQDEEFVEYALEEDVERATRTLMKYAADRAPEDNIALSVLFVPSRNRKMVQTGPRLSRNQRAGIGIFLLAILLLIGFLAMQVAAGESQKVAILSTQTFVQQIIIQASWTATNTPLPPTATPTQEIIIGQVGNRFAVGQQTIPIFNGRFVDPLNPPVINYIGLVSSTRSDINQANLYLQPETSLRVNKVTDDVGKEHFDMVMGHSGNLFINMGDYQNGGVSVALEQNTDITIDSQSACLSVKQIVPESATDTDKVALACYGSNSESCSFHLTNVDAPISVAPGQQAVLDITNQKLLSSNLIAQADVNLYRETIHSLNTNLNQLSCLKDYLDEDNDYISYPTDLCPAQTARGTRDGCPVPGDPDGDNIADANDYCPFAPGPADNNGCPTDGPIATSYALTQIAAQQATATPRPSPTATPIPAPVALDDSYSTLGDTALSRSAQSGVLANDTMNGGTITPFEGTTEKGGTVSLLSDGSFKYTPPAGYIGTDSFDYQLTSEDGTSSASVIITITEPPPKPPVAGFTVSPSSGNSPLTVVLTNTSSGQINGYDWDFGDGSPHSFSSVPGPHVYKNTGSSVATFTITLTVTGINDVTSTASHQVTVNSAPPIACFTPANSNVAVGTPVLFDASCSTGAIDSYSWKFSDTTTTSSGSTTSHTFTTLDTFTVTLTVTGPGGSTSASGVVVTQSPLPNACFNIANPTVNIGDAVNFDATCSTGTINTYVWDFGDGKAGSGQTTSHPYTTANTFTVKLTVSNASGSRSVTHTVTVNTLTTAPTGCTITPPNSATTTVNFDVNCTGGSPIATYAWNFGDTANNTAAVKAPTHIYTKFGKFSVSVTLTGTNGQIAVVPAQISVGPLPVAAADTFNMDMYNAAPPNTFVQAAPGVLANDTLNGGTLSNHTLPTQGQLNTFAANGGFSYTPTLGFAGKDTFTYTLTNLTGDSNPLGTVTMCVNPVPKADSYVVTKGNTLTVVGSGVIGNDTIPSGGATATFNTGATQGTVTQTVAGGGAFTYTPPNPGFTGADTFQYTLTLGLLGCTYKTATVTINVVAANTPPVAVNDPQVAGDYTTKFNKTLTIGVAKGVLANDTDAENNPLSAVLDVGPTRGTLVLNGDGSFVYTPTTGLSGADSFTYHATDGEGNSNIATVNIMVNTNAAPVAVADNYNVPLGSSLTVAAPGVLLNDTDADNDPLIATRTSAVSGGTLTFTSDGAFTFTPPGGAVVGNAYTFTYHANDGSANSPDVTVTITVTAAGSNNPPVAAADTYTTPTNSVLVINAAQGVLANDNDPDGDAMTAYLVNPAPFSGTVTLNPDGSFTFTPTPGFTGIATFHYQASDTQFSASAVTLVTINVTPKPVANGDSYDTPVDTVLTVPAGTGVLVNDTPTGAVTAQLSFGPFYGTLAGGLNADGSFTYTPPPAFVGQDFIYYQAFDGTSYSDIVFVTINVGLVAPVANDDPGYTVASGVPLVITNPALGVLANDTDPNNNPQAYLFSAPTNGGVNLNIDGTFTYTPNPGFTNGVDTFTYYIWNNVNVSPTATVTITVGGGGSTVPVASDDPAVPNDPLYSTKVGVALTVAAPGVLMNDLQGSNPPITAVPIVAGATAKGGVVTLNADGSFDYTPPSATFRGKDTFTYIVVDNIGTNSLPATVTISVGVTARRAAAIQIPAPPPATACTNVNFENPGEIRSHFTNDIDRDQLFCRLIAANGNYMYWFGSPITSSGNVGSLPVLDLGLVGAVDVFSMRQATGFVGDVDICLKGSGYMIYMNANGAPRVPQLWSAWTTDAFPGYTCTTLYAPGTVILVSNKPH